MGVRSLDGEDPLEEEMATRSSILAWKTPWTEKPGRPQSMRSQSEWAMELEPEAWSDPASVLRHSVGYNSWRPFGL